MNILIINHHTNIEKYGGNSRHYAIGKYLSGKGHNVLLVGTSYNSRKNTYRHDDLVRLDKINENFSYISIRSKPKYKSFFLRLINYIDFTIKSSFIKPTFKPDIVVGSSVHPFVWISAYKLARKYNAEFHIEIRDIWPLSLYEELPRISREPIFKISKYYEKFFYSKARGIIVTAPLTNKYLSEEFGVENERVNYVPHGIDILKYDELKNHNIASITLSGKINITYTGSLSASEGLENFIELAAKFKNNNDLHFNIFGDGNQRNKLLRMISEKRISNITLYGQVNGTNIPWVLENSDILWCGLKNRKAFKYSISKNKFYDYLASSKPIIFHSDVKSSPLESSGVAFIVPLKRLPVHELEILINDIELREELGEKGRKFVEENHDISFIAKKYINNFKKE